MSENEIGTQSGDFITLSDESQVVELLRESVQGLWRVVNNLTRLRPTKSSEFRCF